MADAALRTSCSRGQVGTSCHALDVPSVTDTGPADRVLCCSLLQRQTIWICVQEPYPGQHLLDLLCSEPHRQQDTITNYRSGCVSAPPNPPLPDTTLRDRPGASSVVTRTARQRCKVTGRCRVSFARRAMGKDAWNESYRPVDPQRPRENAAQ